MSDVASQLIELNSGIVEVRTRGSGDLVVLLPGGQQLNDEFDHLSATLSENGYRPAALNHPGFGRSSPPGDDWNLHDLANVVAEYIEHSGGGPAHVGGHAFGNRVARCLAADRPELVRSIMLFSAGGKFPPTPDGLAGVTGDMPHGNSDVEGIERMRKAFFAPGNDPSLWIADRSEVRPKGTFAAMRRTSVDDWWDAGNKAPILVVQGLQDAVAVPENGRALKSALDDRVELVEIDGAGHALLPEKPDEVASAVISFLDRHTPTST